MRRRTIDIACTRPMLACFIDGCYWHKCPDHFVEPRTNADYWAPKLAANVTRDRDTDRLLALHGWTVVRFWEHERPEAVAEAIRTVLSEPW